MDDINPIQSITESHPVKDSNDNKLREILAQAAKVKRKPQEEQNRLTEFILKFNNSLAKLSESSTKEIGMKELQEMIKANKNFNALKIYLGVLSDGAKDPNINGKELHVLILGYIAKIYTQELENSEDNFQNLAKIITRICEIIRRYLAVISILTLRAILL